MNEKEYLKNLDFLNKYDEQEIPWKFSFILGKYIQNNIDFDSINKKILSYSQASLGIIFIIYLLITYMVLGIYL